eukprot:944573-Rhodomonas_salina.2
MQSAEVENGLRGYHADAVEVPPSEGPGTVPQPEPRPASRPPARVLSPPGPAVPTLSATAEAGQDVGMSEAGVAEKSPSNSPAKKKSESAAQAGRSAQTKGKQTAGRKNGRGSRGMREEGDGDGDEMQPTDIPPLRPPRSHHAAGSALSQPDNGEESSSGPSGGSKRGRPVPPPLPPRSPQKPARAEQDVPEPASGPAPHSMPAVCGAARIDYSTYKGALLDWHSSCLIGKRRAMMTCRSLRQSIVVPRAAVVT